MRHGQTRFNARRKIQGACDSPLTEEGIRQANIAKAYIEESGIVFDHAYSSTQERASDTLELITKLPYTRLKGLKEWDFGTFEGESEDLNPPFNLAKKTYGDFFVQYGGESDLTVQKRMNQTLIEIMDKQDHEHVLAVGHGGACFVFRRLWTDLDLGKTLNCSILKFEYENKKFKFIELINHDF